jgi:hypothetical protein
MERHAARRRTVVTVRLYSWRNEEEAPMFNRTISLTIAAAALAANIADATAANHYRHAGASTHKLSWVSHYAPSDHGRYTYGVSLRSGARPEPEHRGIFAPEVEVGGP